MGHLRRLQVFSSSFVRRTGNAKLQSAARVSAVFGSGAFGSHAREEARSRKRRLSCFDARRETFRRGRAGARLASGVLAAVRADIPASADATATGPRQRKSDKLPRTSTPVRAYGDPERTFVPPPSVHPTTTAPAASRGLRSGQRNASFWLASWSLIARCAGWPFGNPQIVYVADCERNALGSFQAATGGIYWTPYLSSQWVLQGACAEGDPCLPITASSAVGSGRCAIAV